MYPYLQGDILYKWKKEGTSSEDFNTLKWKSMIDDF